MFQCSGICDLPSKGQSFTPKETATYISEDTTLRYCMLCAAAFLYPVSAVRNAVDTDALAAPSKTWVNSRSLAGITGSNTVKGMVFCFVIAMFVVR